ncbi:receptor-like protein kinase [Trifolium pratense]|uniref:Receptor-like protein kinase n=4 Tax=Trifolium TaxID=3898 RepID=A0A2K3NJH6_TRIPR|nr:rust resistance kinase Lr10-like [Trifolium pratense]PNY03173.1 receptor-like protein kinase [Trifolium pratense]
MSLFTIILALLLLVNLENGLSDASIECPFKLNCTHNKKFLELPAHPVPVNLIITHIDYIYRLLYLSDPGNCLPKLILDHNFSSIFPLKNSFEGNISFFNCSSVVQLRTTDYVNQGGLDIKSCPIYVADSDYESIVESDLVYCIKMFDRESSFYKQSAQSIQNNLLSFTWEGTNFDIRCLKCEHKSKKKITFIILSSAGVIIGSTLLVFVLGAIVRIHLHFKMKGEDHTRIENFLKDYKALKPTRFSYADIKRITNKFKDKLGEGAHGAVYKGKLSSQILVAVKMLNNAEGDGKEFINEVGTMGKIHHLNVVRLLGYCADGFHRALVYDFFPNGSLQKFISPPSNKDSFLGWDKLQQIALGIASGIEYLHQGCDERILHFDINPHNVLIDDSFIPKITDFGLAKICSKNQSIVSMTAARGTLGYMAPEVFSRNFGNVSYKSDIYSYGMLLLEIVGGRKNTNTTTNEDNFQVLYPDWIHSLLEGGDIQIPIDEEGDFRIAKKLAIVGLWCIQWQPMHRPSMKTVMQMLQGDEDKLKVPSNPFGPTTSANTTTNVVAKRINLELEVIEEID